MPVQNVNVVNPIECKIDENSDLTVKFPDSYLKAVGDTKLVNTAPSNSNTWSIVKPYANYFTLQISNVTVTIGGSAIDHHIGSVYYNLSQSQIEYALHTLLTAYHAQNPSATSVVVNYSRLNSSGQIEHNYVAFSDI